MLICQSVSWVEKGLNISLDRLQVTSETNLLANLLTEWYQRNTMTIIYSALKTNQSTIDREKLLDLSQFCNIIAIYKVDSEKNEHMWL